MARYVCQGTYRDQSGVVVPSAVVKVYLAGSTTPASIYAASSGGVAVNQVSCDSLGRFTFFVDSGDYPAKTAFKIVFIESGYTTQTYDNVIIQWA